MSERDPLLEALRDEARAVDVDDWRRENVRGRAQAELRNAGRRVPGAGFYRRVLEPAGVAVVSCGWIMWAAQRVITLQGG